MIPEPPEGASAEDMHRLKMSLHRAIDEAFAGFSLARSVVPIEHIEFTQELPDWDWRGPRAVERMSQSWEFLVRTAEGPEETPVRVQGRIGWTTRESYGRADRGRWIVFGRIGETDRYYPWLEWVETDTGMVAAEAPDPVQPRKGILDPRQAPDFLEGIDLARSDELFDNIASGKTLRMLLPQSDTRQMVRIGAEVGRLRERPPWRLGRGPQKT